MPRGLADYPTPRSQTAQPTDQRLRASLEDTVHSLSKVLKVASGPLKPIYQQTDPTWVNPLGKPAHVGVARVGGWSKTHASERRCWDDLVARQNRAFASARTREAGRPNSAAAATWEADDRVHRIDAAFHTCLAELSEIQRTNPAASAGLRKLEAARRRSFRREAAEQATAERLTGTWTVARCGKVPNEHHIEWLR